MPAEWESHAATWLAWPHNRSDWPGKFPPVPWVVAEVARIIAAGETVHILAPTDAVRASATRTLRRAGADLARIVLHVVPTDRIWTRDSGPIFLRRARDGALAVVDFHFNAWAKYDDWKRDDRLPAWIARHERVPRVEAWVAHLDGRPHRLVLEGGSIDVDGHGTVMTTEECLLSDVQARNPGLSRDGVESALGAFLGARQVLWLGRGIAGDDTHGHIDDTARFTGPRTIVACLEPDPRDDNHAPLAENLARLRAARDAGGRPYDIVELPMPAAVIFSGQRLPASYANFYVANAAVLVPVFNDPHDRIALDVLQGCFADRPVVPVYCRDLVWGLGTIHCMTQQQPALDRP